MLHARRSALALLALVAVGSGASAVAASTAAPGADRTYRGRTAQGIAIRLGPERSAGRAFRYRARLACSDGSSFLDRYFTDDVRVRDGRFSSRFTSDGGAVLTHVKGTLRGLRARGTIRIEERYSEVPDSRGDTPLAADGAITCDSRVVHWHAVARRAAATRRPRRQSADSAL